MVSAAEPYGRNLVPDRTTFITTYSVLPDLSSNPGTSLSETRD
jgi:hypothetical protein